MKVLVIGNGGREHAICWKIKRDDPSVDLYCAPGNAGTGSLGTNVGINADDVAGICAWARENSPDLVMVGPEAPLCIGLVDALAEIGIRAFGPSKAAARMEGSKQYAKEIMRKAGVPTADAENVDTLDAARAAIKRMGGAPIVIKEDGLAAGKGVFVCMKDKDVEPALAAAFPDDGKPHPVLIEQFLDGEEVSLLAFVDGKNVVPMVSAQDHKRLLNNDEGPNTGGMGAYSPAPAMTPDMKEVVMNRVFRPVVATLAAEGVDYKGVLYAGLMLTKNGPKVLEFNCRFGDPETQCLMPRLSTPLLPILQACIDGRLQPEMVEWSSKPCVCVVMASAGYPGKYDKGAKISGLDEAAEIQDAVVFHAGTEMKGGAVCTSGGRVLGVTSTGADIADAVRNAYHAVLAVKFDGAQYRSDIAHRALARLA